MLTESKVIEIVAAALKVSTATVSKETSAQSSQHWDSLAQIDILAKLDRETQGKSTHLQGLPTAFSVKEILEQLRNAGLVSAH